MGKSDEENHPNHISIFALRQHFDVEIDVWKVNKVEWYLGHDKPQYKVSIDFLKEQKLFSKKYRGFMMGMNKEGVH